MKIFKKILKILFFPVFIIGTLLLLLYTTDISSRFFQDVIYDTLIVVYRFLFPFERNVFTIMFGSMWLYCMLISLFFILILLLIHIFVKDRYIRIGIKITIGLFIVLFLFGFGILIFAI
jgi:hypothetical protein